REFKGKTVQLMIRFANHRTITRSRKLPTYVQKKEEIFPIILELLNEHWQKEPVRLLGVTVQELLEAKLVVEQLDLFTYKEKTKQFNIKQTVEELKDRFGEKTFLDISSDEKKDSDEKLYRTS